MAADPGMIILYKNDGSGEEDSWVQNAPSINDIGWSRDGYNFIEWNTESDGTGDSYFPGDFVGNDHNPPLYAIWEEIPILQKQPVLTYSINWGTGNIFQKLSGKTYVSPSGQTIDCSTLTVTFSSSQHFKKFYATAVKSGNDYGFIDDILVDIKETNPTGVLLYELTERNANVNFSFTINTSSLTSGDGEYRIGLYVQNDDGVWNYEYFLLEANNLQLEESNNLLLQVPVQTTDEEVPDCGFVVNGNTLTITDSSKLSDGIINSDDYLYVSLSLSEESYGYLSELIAQLGTGSIDIRLFNDALADYEIYNEGLSVLLTDGTNNYQVLLNKNVFNYIKLALFINDSGGCFVIHKNTFENNFNILNETDFYYTLYDYNNNDLCQLIEFDLRDVISTYSFLDLPYEDRIIEEIINRPDGNYFELSYNYID